MTSSFFWDSSVTRWNDRVKRHPSSLLFLSSQCLDYLDPVKLVSVKVANLMLRHNVFNGKAGSYHRMTEAENFKTT
ncbi:hypothetical protein [Wolbachia endosymbiont (group A) of Agelastica alni]|uniref:hypothetical protein n=1 Tax=Wolbachia endosymbiont (group A) of Agelastica alni TaxID=3066130 RepID=UPI0031331936